MDKTLAWVPVNGAQGQRDFENRAFACSRHDDRSDASSRARVAWRSRISFSNSRSVIAFSIEPGLRDDGFVDALNEQRLVRQKFDHEIYQDRQRPIGLWRMGDAGISRLPKPISAPDITKWRLPYGRRRYF